MSTKKMTTGELNLMKKFDITNVDAPPTTVRYNRFSGVPADLNEAAAKIYDLIQDMQDKYDRGDPSFKVQDFDRLRYLFLKLWPDEYMDLLD